MTYISRPVTEQMNAGHLSALVGIFKHGKDGPKHKKMAKPEFSLTGKERNYNYVTSYDAHSISRPDCQVSHR